MNKKSIWKKGPPPHVGWWNASCGRFSTAWRWWDGKCWSWVAYEDFSAREAAVAAQKKCAVYGVEWTRRWPEGARVLRAAA